MSTLSVSSSGDRINRRQRVLIASPGKHLFLRLRDPRIFIYQEGAEREPTPDLVVFPCSQISELQGLADRLPQVTRARLASGKARVVLDASGEGRGHGEEITEQLHRFVTSIGGLVGRAAYITQNRFYRRDYLDYCERTGVRRPMTVLCYDYWIKRFFHPYETEGAAVFAERLEAFRARSATRERRFISLNFSPRPIKIIFLLNLMKEGLWDQGFVSFGGFGRLSAMGEQERDTARLIKLTRRLEGFKRLYWKAAAFVPQLEAVGRVQVGDINTVKIADDLPLTEYRRSWFSAVTESEMGDEPTRITEKPFKPLINFHPIVMFGNPGSLAAVRALGFQTFPELFDESYDDEPSPPRRFEMAFAEFVRLCRMDEAELARLEASIVEKLEFNARFGLTELPGRYRNEFDRALVDELAR